MKGLLSNLEIPALKPKHMGDFSPLFGWVFSTLKGLKPPPLPIFLLAPELLLKGIL